MIYDGLTEIRSAISETNIFPAANLFLGEEFQIGADNTPFCIIKSGSGPVDGRRVTAVAHVMALFMDSSNIEQTVNANMKTIARAIAQIDQARVTFFTTDEDIFQPFGIAFNPVPPFGGFRFEVEILEVL